MKYGLLTVILLGSCVVSYAAESELCDQEHCSNFNDKSCKCWCSIKCGPREKGVRAGVQDTPRWNKKYKKCFCQDRDENLYVKNCLSKDE